MFVFFLLISIISFFYRENIIFNSFFIFSVILISFFFIYYLLLFLYCLKKRKQFNKLFQIPEEIDNSNLDFDFKISPIFFLTEFKLILISDKCEIFFTYDNKKKKFQSIPFYRGKHYIKKFQIIFSDPFKIFSIKIKLNANEFYNFFKYGSSLTHQGILPLTSNEHRKYRTIDDSVLVRDYLFGDDVRKILWRIYAISDDIKVRTEWLEKTSYNYLPIYVCGIYADNYFFSNLIIYKIFSLVKVLIQNKCNISLNGKAFNEKDDKAIQKEIFEIYEKEKKNGINFDFSQSSILLFTASAIKNNPTKELWIPKNKSIYYITLKDFFTIDKKNYYNTASFISLFIKKPIMSSITKLYFSNYSDYDELYEKRYQIV